MTENPTLAKSTEKSTHQQEMLEEIASKAPDVLPMLEKLLSTVASKIREQGVSAVAKPRKTIFQPTDKKLDVGSLISLQNGRMVNGFAVYSCDVPNTTIADVENPWFWHGCLETLNSPCFVFICYCADGVVELAVRRIVDHSTRKENISVLRLAGDMWVNASSTEDSQPSQAKDKPLQ